MLLNRGCAPFVALPDIYGNIVDKLPEIAVILAGFACCSVIFEPATNDIVMLSVVVS